MLPSICTSRSECPCSDGIDPISPVVYGWRGWWMTSRTGPILSLIHISDRRQTRVVITTKGRHLIGALCEQAMQHQKAVLAPFGEDQAALLIDMLRRLMAEHVPLDLPLDADE